LAGDDAGRNAAYLQLVARQAGPAWLADQIDRLPVALPWAVRWAAWLPTTPYRIVGRHAGPVTAITMTELHGRPVIISAGDDATLRLWDPQTATPIGQPLTGHQGPIRTITTATLHDRPVIISAGDDATLRLWDPQTATPIGQPLIGHDAVVRAVVAVTTSDGVTGLVSGGHDRMIRMWGAGALWGDASSKREDRAPVIREQEDSVTALAQDRVADARAIIAVGLQSGRIRFLWENAAGAEDDLNASRVWSGLVGHVGSINAVAMGRADGSLVVVSGGQDSTVRLWDPGFERGGTDRRSTRFPFGASELRSLNVVAMARVSAEDLLVASASQDGTIHLWDPSNGKPTTTITGHHGPVSALTIGQLSKGQPIVVSGGHDQTVQLWDPNTARQLGPTLRGHSRWIRAVALGRRQNGCPVVASASLDGTIHLWDPLSSKPTITITLPHGSVGSLTVGQLPTGQAIVVSGGDDGVIRIHDVETGNPVGPQFFAHWEPITSVARAPAKSRFVQFVPRTRWPRSQVAGSSRVASRERARRPTRTFRYFAGALLP